MKKIERPYIRVTFKGYYPEGSTEKLRLNLYIRKLSLVGKIVEFLAPYVFQPGKKKIINKLGGK